MVKPKPKYTEDEMWSKAVDHIGGAAMIFLFIIGIISVCIIEYYDERIYDQLDIDLDEIAKEYVVSYYPEYNNCSMDFINLDTGIDSVNIYCNSLEDRDGLSTKQPQEADFKIYFEDITIEQIIKDKIGACLE